MKHNMRIHHLTALLLLAVANAVQAQDPTASTQPVSTVPVSPYSNQKPTALAGPDAPIRELAGPDASIGVLAGPNAPMGSLGSSTTSESQGKYNIVLRQPGTAPENAGPLILFGQPDPKALDETAEDLNVFGFIVNRNLENALGEQAPEVKLGVPILLESGGRLVEESYIEGFGALFNLRVGFPVVAPPAAAEKSETTEGPSDWEKARAALYGGNAAAPAEFGQDPYRRTEPYNAKLVEILKKQVLESLKSAANLRHVKSDEWVVVTITGSPNTSAPQTAATVQPKGNYNAGVQTSRGSGRATIMTIRVKKSAAEALSAKHGSAEQFWGKVEVNAYLGAEVPSRSAAGALIRARPFGVTTWQAR
jgi:hypothetical protein